INGQNADLTPRAQEGRIIGLIPRLHTDLAKLPFLRTLPPDVMKRYTDYHELGHCMDTYYLDKAGFDPMQNIDLWIEMRHQAEVYGEVFATLMLARDGVNNVAGIRADHRLASIALNGTFLVQMAQGDPV